LSDSGSIPVLLVLFFPGHPQSRRAVGPAQMRASIPARKDKQGTSGALAPDDGPGSRQPALERSADGTDVLRGRFPIPFSLSPTFKSIFAHPAADHLAMGQISGFYHPFLCSNVSDKYGAYRLWHGTGNCRRGRISNGGPND